MSWIFVNGHLCWIGEISMCNVNSDGSKLWVLLAIAFTGFGQKQVKRSQSSKILHPLPHWKVKEQTHCLLRFLSFLFQKLSSSLSLSFPKSVNGAAYVSFVRILLGYNKGLETKKFNESPTHPTHFNKRHET